MVERRVAGLPLEHVLGWAEFCGLRVAVDARRLRAAPPHRVPRPPGRRADSPGGRDRTPGLRLAPAVVVDLCCGSGAVGAALAAALDRVELYAADVDPAAVRCARRNCSPPVAGSYEGDLYEPLPAVAAGPRRHPGRQRAVRTNRGDRAAAPGGPHPRAADGARRRRGRPRRPAAGDRRGPGVAGAGRPPAGRDERAPGAAGRRSRRRQRTDRRGWPFPTSSTPPS